MHLLQGFHQSVVLYVIRRFTVFAPPQDPRRKLIHLESRMSQTCAVVDSLDYGPILICQLPEGSRSPCYGSKQRTHTAMDIVEEISAHTLQWIFWIGE
ncbi:hypothetical protein DPMN_074938 [Dreissena polymorpha]|uniref:Uncharacterized protein n=1 Tax=Dreissena polymorpha TaxID=45954 RepID=A0A9D4BM61_DREPO|nr:hypothetical protein DPMN_074938 [Dreissena polymorpha]